jgi:hypothetical protein
MEGHMKRPKLKYFILAVSVILLAVLIMWVLLPLARERSTYVAMGREWMSLLHKHPAFSAQETEYPVEVDYYYAVSTDDSLTKLRQMYDLDTIAGQDSETERIVNLMTWVYNLAAHANKPAIPGNRNAFSFIHMATVENKQINCYMKTVILNEVYLAMGFFSRHTHLLPYLHEEEESHFITSVFSRTLDKWILMDPDFGVYVTDEHGTILGIREIRHRMIAGEPLKIHHPGRSYFENVWIDINNFIEGADYPWFLSEFIFKMRCPKYSMFGQDSGPVREYYELIPDDYREEQLLEPRVTPRGKKIYTINDEDIFWRKPEEMSL